MCCQSGGRAAARGPKTLTSMLSLSHRVTDGRSKDAQNNTEHLTAVKVYASQWHNLFFSAPKIAMLQNFS